MKFRVELQVLVILTMLSTVAFAGSGECEPSCANYENYFHWSGWNKTDGQYYSVDISRDHSYVTDRFGSVHVYDLSDPGSPQRVAEMPCGEDPMDIRVHDTIGLVRVSREDAYREGYFFNDLYLVDIAVPTSPSIILILEAFGFRSSAEAAGHVYLGVDEGLVVVNVSDPGSPVTSEVDPVHETITVIGVVGDHLLVRTPTRICSLDIADPFSPVLVSELAISETRWSFQIVEDRLFVLTSDRLIEIDISVPESLSVSGQLLLDQDASFGGLRQMIADEETAFIIRSFIGEGPFEETDVIQVVDVSTTGSPTFKGDILVPRQDMVEYRSPYLYSRAEHGLCVIDASERTSPRVVLWTDFVLGSRSIACNASHMYTTNDAGISTFEFANEPILPPLERIETPGLARGLDVAGRFAYVSDWRDGVQVIDIESCGEGMISASLPIGGPTTNLVADGEYLYVGDRTNGLVIADIKNPTQPEIVNTILLEKGADELAVAGELLAVGGGKDLVLFDKSDPGRPFQLGFWEAPSVINGIVLSGDLAFLTAGSNLVIADLSDPGSISILSTLVLPHSGEGLTVVGDFAYVGIFRAGVVIVDVSDPSLPTITALKVTPDACYNVTHHGNYIYASGGQAGVQIIDISMPESPQLIGRAGYIIPSPTNSHLLRFVRDAEVAQGRLYFVDEFGLQVVPLQCGENLEAIEVVLDLKPGNMTDPVNCGSRGQVRVAILTTLDFDALEVDHETVVFGPGEAHEARANRHGIKRQEVDVDHDGDMDLLFHFRARDADLDCSLGEATLKGRTLDGRDIVGTATFRSVPNPGRKPLVKVGLSAKPNPFNPQTTIVFELPQVQVASLRIYDLGGTLIKTLIDDAVVNAGTNEVVWNGRDDAGRQVASGTYFYRLEVGNYSETKRMVLVK